VSDAPAQAGQGGFTTRMQRTVEWGDCDPAGIIFYPTYYRWDGRGELAPVCRGRLQRRPHAGRTPEPAAGAHRVQLRALPHIWRALHRRVLRGAAGRQVVHRAASFSGWRRRARTGQRPRDPRLVPGTKPALAHRCGARRCPKPCGCGWPAKPEALGTGLPASALALVMLAGLIHASWNIAAKKAGGDARFAAFTGVVMTVFWAPLGPVAGLAAGSALGPGALGLHPGQRGAAPGVLPRTAARLPQGRSHRGLPAGARLGAPCCRPWWRSCCWASASRCWERRASAAWWGACF
jgi:hypothetical protein